MTVQNTTSYDAHTQTLFCCGSWTLNDYTPLRTLLTTLKLPSTGKLTIDGQGITALDTAGAFLLATFLQTCKTQGATIQRTHISEEHALLLSLVGEKLSEDVALPTPPATSFVARIGHTTRELLDGFAAYLSFIGELSSQALRIFRHPSRFRLQSLAGVLYRTGYQALPIIALLSFMIGVVITYQMGLQLKNYGANIFIVDLLGLSILREFGPLITAIMVAGRTGSAYTAQLGMMKLNQEIDALDTMGVPPAELLLLPRILGLFIALPLLTFWADVFGVIGGMVMSNNMLNITWYDFMNRFPHVIPLRALLLGLGKAPVFALIIASVGCFQGMTVAVSADSVGKNTTRSVVMSIFFIIVADALFSVLFSKLKL